VNPMKITVETITCDHPGCEKTTLADKPLTAWWRHTPTGDYCPTHWTD
jgi:hypothetical protein